LRANLDNWQKTAWKWISVPGTELVATLALVMLATWFLVQDGGLLHGAGFPVFAQR
jgi:hypothetical protein